MELIALSIGGALVAFMTWAAATMTYDSWMLNDLSSGVISVPLWIPQMSFTIGSGVLLIAFIDELVHVALADSPLRQAAAQNQRRNYRARGFGEFVTMQLELVEIAISLLAVMGFALILGVWVGLALVLSGIAAMMFVSSRADWRVFATTVWSANASWTLSALPLFIWMGEILFRTRLSQDLFQEAIALGELDTSRPTC